MPYNFRKKAQIFCGDVGSLLTGFIFAVASLMLVKEVPELPFLYVGPILLLPFLADILMTLFSRLKRKENCRREINRYSSNSKRLSSQ